MAKMFDAKRPQVSSEQQLRAVPIGQQDLSANTRMAYMADLLLELKDMATAEGHATLAGLLALAHMEALSKSR